MTYVAQFLHRYPDPRGAEDTVSNLTDEYRLLSSWLIDTTTRMQQLIDTNSLPNSYAVSIVQGE